MASTYIVEHQVQILASLDTDQKLISFKRSGETIIKVTRALEVGVGETREVPASATDQALSFGLVGTGQWLYLESDRELLVKINGSTTAMKLTLGVAGTAKMMWDGEFTAITVTNEDAANAAILSYCIAGVP